MAPKRVAKPIFTGSLLKRLIESLKPVSGRVTRLLGDKAASFAKDIVVY